MELEKNIDSTNSVIINQNELTKTSGSTLRAIVIGILVFAGVVGVAGILGYIVGIVEKYTDIL